MSGPGADMDGSRSSECGVPRSGSRWDRTCGAFLGLLLAFAVFARGAHDLWAATLVYLSIAGLCAAVLLRRCWSADSLGVRVDLLPELSAAALAAALSFLYSVQPAQAWMGWMGLLAALGAFWAAREVLREERAMSAAAAAVTLVLWVELAAILLRKIREGPFLYAYSGTLPNANILAGFILLWIPAIFQRARGKQGWTGTYWKAALAAALFDLLLLESSWGILTLLAASPLLWGPRAFAEKVRRHPGRARAAAAAAGVVVAGMLLWKFTTHYALDGRPLFAGESSSRLRWWGSAWRMFLDHPWTGVGAGCFPGAYLAYKAAGTQSTLYAHSVFFSVLAELGLPGLAALLWLFVAWGRALLREPGRLEERWPRILGPLMLLGFSLAHLSLDYLVNIIALAVMAGAASAGELGRRFRPRRRLQVCMAAAVLAAVPYLAAPLAADRLRVGARLELAAGDEAAALRDFSAATELDPRVWEAWRGLADLRARDFEKSKAPASAEEAVRLRRMAVERNRLDGALWAELARDLLSAGRGREALEACRRALRLNGPSSCRRMFEDGASSGAAPAGSKP